MDDGAIMIEWHGLCRERRARHAHPEWPTGCEARCAFTRLAPNAELNQNRYDNDTRARLSSFKDHSASELCTLGIS